jgi:hypothetical protein
MSGSGQHDWQCEKKNLKHGSEFDISCPKKVELMRVNFRNLIYFGQQ